MTMSDEGDERPGPVARARKAAKGAALELELHARRLRMPKRRPSVFIFPSNQPWDPASNLRAWLIGPELERLGWRVVSVPEPLSLSQRRRLLALERPDVIFMQQTRHLLNQPKLYPGFATVIDADDADYLDPRHQARIAASAADASAVIGGSRFVAACLGAHNPRAHVLWTSTPLPTSTPAIPPEKRGPIVSWAHASPLGYHHEATFIRDVMTDVCRRTACTFWLFGTQEHQATEWFAPLRAAGGRCEAIGSLGYDAYLAKVAESAVGIQPVSPEHEFSQGKSFGKLLAYLSGQVAVVASRAVDHPRFFRDGWNGLLPEHDVKAWSDAIVSLVDDRAHSAVIARRGWEDFKSRLTSEVFARLLDPILREAAGLPLDANAEASLRTRDFAAPRRGERPTHRPTLVGPVGL